MSRQLHKKKGKELYNVWSSVVDDYIYQWSSKEIISTHIYSDFYKEARRKAKKFMEEIDQEV